MRCDVDSNGNIQILAENELEKYCLKQFKRNLEYKFYIKEVEPGLEVCSLTLTHKKE